MDRILCTVKGWCFYMMEVAWQIQLRGTELLCQARGGYILRPPPLDAGDWRQADLQRRRPGSSLVRSLQKSPSHGFARCL